MVNRTRWYIAGGAILILVIMVALLHHSSNMANNSGTNMAATSTNMVSIKNYMFDPMTIKVKAGTTVTWANQDPVHHSVTADAAAKGAPSGPLIGQGQSYSFKFTKPGTYTFHCTPHPYMHGTVIVTN